MTVKMAAIGYNIHSLTSRAHNYDNKLSVGLYVFGISEYNGMKIKSTIVSKTLIIKNGGQMTATAYNYSYFDF